MLEQKLATLQRLLTNTQEASESSWQVGNTLVTSGVVEALHTKAVQYITLQGRWQIAAPNPLKRPPMKGDNLSKLIQRVDVLTRL